MKKILITAITFIITLIFIILSFTLLINFFAIISILSKHVIYYFSGYDYPWMYRIRYNFFEIIKGIIIATQIRLLWSLISNKSKIDTFNLKWLKIPFFLTMLSFLSSFLIRFYNHEINAFSRSIDEYHYIALCLFYYLILFVGQNFLSYYKKIWWSKYISYFIIGGII